MIVEAIEIVMERVEVHIDQHEDVMEESPQSHHVDIEKHEEHQEHVDEVKEAEPAILVVEESIGHVVIDSQLHAKPLKPENKVKRAIAKTPAPQLEGQ